jgi:hypothetical protein
MQMKEERDKEGGIPELLVGIVEFAVLQEEGLEARQLASEVHVGYAERGARQIEASHRWREICHRRPRQQGIYCGPMSSLAEL